MKKWLSAREAATELGMALSTFYAKFKDSESLNAVDDSQRVEISIERCRRLHGKGFYYRIGSELFRLD